MPNVSVSWYPNYTIHIENIDGSTVHHLSEALRRYTAERRANDADAMVFDQIIEVCGSITEIDDRD